MTLVVFESELGKHVSRITRENSPAVGLACLQTLEKLCTNIIDSPNDAKYQSLRSRNSKIKSTILNPTGGSEVLTLLGFTKRVQEFEEVWHFSASESSLNKLRKAQVILGESLQGAKQEAERVEQKAKEAKEKGSAEQQRREEVLRHIEADRQNVKERVAREKYMR
ncbi:hypothetical protein HK097_011208 [Rhizophlyctis rosea]|uniref:PUB domain-containing protein n=1 Tax=Rhizophlyctis rosea TaxID=64517 RepID=A0AAD5SID0_9FUNG|nr:hypothetical protein HK097_011208 [Rhizophlyctis rosea]